MEIGLSKTIGGKYMVVDASPNEEGAPLIKFSNEFNKPGIPEIIFDYICSEEFKNKVSERSVEAFGAAAEKVVTRFDLIDCGEE